MEHSLNDVASVKSSQNGDHHPKILAKKNRSARSRSSNRASKNVILHQPYHPQEHDHNIRDINHKHQEHAENPAGTFEVVTFLPNAEGELKDIPGFGQVLETRSLQDGKVERYPISTIAAHGAQQEVALKNTSSVGGSTTADLGRFLVQDDSSQENENIRGGSGEPAVITLAMEHHRNDDHYLSAVSHDVDLDHDIVVKEDHEMTYMPQNLSNKILQHEEATKIYADLDAVQNAMVTSSHPEFHAEVVVPMSEADAAVAAATYMPLHVTILEFLALECFNIKNLILAYF